MFHFPINEILQKCTRSRNGLIKTLCRKCFLKVTEDTRDFSTKEISAPRRSPKIPRISVGQGEEGSFFLGEVLIHLAAVKGPGLFCLEIDRRFRGVLISQLCLLTGEGAGVLQAALTGAGRIYLGFSTSKLPRACKEIKGNNKV